MNTRTWGILQQTTNTAALGNYFTSNVNGYSRSSERRIFLPKQATQLASNYDTVRELDESCATTNKLIKKQLSALLTAVAPTRKPIPAKLALANAG